jgi:hypothetical protein
MKLKFFLCPIIGLILFIGCIDEDIFDPTKEQLPNATKSGANTFGFLLNDQTWVPYADANKGIPISVIMNKDSVFMFSINLCNDKIKRDESLKIILKCIRPQLVKPISFTYIDNKLKLGCQVFDLDTDKLRLEITYIDFTKRIISGTFEITDVINACGNASINFKNGRFDCTFSN